jgi:hypothetical protein
MTIFYCLASILCNTEDKFIYSYSGGGCFRILVGTLTLLTDVFIFLLWPPGRSRDSTSVMLWLLPSRSYPVNLPSYHSTLQSLVTDMAVKQPTKLLTPHKRFGGICCLYLEAIETLVHIDKTTTRYILAGRSLKSCTFLCVRIGKSRYRIM